MFRYRRRAGKGETLKPKFAPQFWDCTAARAAAVAYPRHLEGAAIAAKLPFKKDMTGRRLMLKYSKPRKPSKNNPAKYHEDIHGLKRVVLYCARDIRAQKHLHAKLPKLHPSERRLWELDQVMNFKGFRVDRGLAKKILRMVKEENRHLNARLYDLTGGKVRTANQRNELLTFVRARISEADLPNLQMKTLADFLKAPKFLKHVSETDQNATLEILKIRQMTSKTSTAKYAALLHRSQSDGFIRDTLLFHVASTGRWGGSGFQPQNLPKPTKALGEFDPEVACEVIADDQLERVRLFYGSPMDAFSGVIRSMIVPRPGHKFVCADFSAIEARVLFWLAGHADGVKAYEQNAPIYEEMATEIFGRPITRADEAERDIGKRVILGCGYGMGAEKFFATCEQYNQPISKELAKKSVAAYRDKHWPVPRMWRNLNAAAVAAIQKPGTRFTTNMVTWFFDKTNLWCTLPSGRRLCYPDASLKFELVFNEKRPVIYYHGMNSLTRKWGLDKTYGGKLTENITQAVARDFMANAILHFATDPILKSKYILSLHVHDELVGETPIGVGNIEEFKKGMTTRPAWGQTCPIAAGGWEGFRYRK